MRLILMLLIPLFLTSVALAQESADVPTDSERSTTGGATTLEDILARQRGEKVDNRYRSDNTGQGNAEGLLGQLGTRGVASDSDVYRAIRYGSADTTSFIQGACGWRSNPGRWHVVAELPHRPLARIRNVHPGRNGGHHRVVFPDPRKNPHRRGKNRPQP